MAAKQRSQDTVGAAPDLSLLELRRVPRVRIDQEIKTDAADRLLQNMLVHYSQPNGFMGRVFIYEIWYDGVFYGHIVAGSATRGITPPQPLQKNEHLNHIINNTFFHIEPDPRTGYPTRNFSSFVLESFLARAQTDWEEEPFSNGKHYKVWAFETLVDPNRGEGMDPRTGEVYRRVGFEEIGMTKGYECWREEGERVWSKEPTCPKIILWRWVLSPAQVADRLHQLKQRTERRRTAKVGDADLVGSRMGGAVDWAYALAQALDRDGAASSSAGPTYISDWPRGPGAYHQYRFDTLHLILKAQERFGLYPHQMPTAAMLAKQIAIDDAIWHGREWDDEEKNYLTTRFELLMLADPIGTVGRLRPFALTAEWVPDRLETLYARCLFWIDPALLSINPDRETAFRMTMMEDAELCEEAISDAEMAIAAMEFLFTQQTVSMEQLYIDFNAHLAEQLFLLLRSYYRGGVPPEVSQAGGAVEAMLRVLPQRLPPEAMATLRVTAQDLDTYAEALAYRERLRWPRSPIYDASSALVLTFGGDPVACSRMAVRRAILLLPLSEAILPWVKNYLRAVALRP